jgi:hypothetical protein
VCRKVSTANSCNTEALPPVFSEGGGPGRGSRFRLGIVTEQPIARWFGISVRVRVKLLCGRTAFPSLWPSWEQKLRVQPGFTKFKRTKTLRCALYPRVIFYGLCKISSGALAELISKRQADIIPLFCAAAAPHIHAPTCDKQGTPLQPSLAQLNQFNSSLPIQPSPNY